MTPAFRVRRSPHFDRLLRRLRHHRELVAILERVEAILSFDPYNRSRKQAIKKLEDVAPGEGQYRLRIGRWRLRYDVAPPEVVLHYCGLRREDTYRR